MEYATHFDFIIENEVRLKRICLKACKERRDLVEEMYSDVVYDVVDKAFQSFNGSGNIEGWIYVNVWRYSARWFQRWIRDKNRKCELIPIECKHTFALDSVESVQQVLDSLSEWHRYIVWLYIGLGYNFGEIATLAQMSESWVRLQYREAMRQLIGINNG